MEPPASQTPATCLSCAKEGERHVRAGRLPTGIQFLERALEMKTDDVALLSAVYAQLGNAYFHLEEYAKAHQYHYYDYNLARLQQDPVGQAKAAGNIGNVFKAQGCYLEAAKFMEIQLQLVKSIGDAKLEATTYYHLGTIYFAKGKQEGKSLKETIGNITTISLRSVEYQAMHEDMLQAVEYFKKNLEMVEEAGLRAAAGRTFGSLGNCFYMLKEFETAADYHMKRLEVAREFGDKPTQKKVYVNLGNTYVMLNQIDRALEYYRLALTLAIELRDKVGQAQTSFSLATASSLGHDYNTAAEYHVRHLMLARELHDSAGELRALFSLGNAYRHIGDYPKAAYFLARNRSIAKEMNDPRVMQSAETSLRELIDEAGDAVLQESGDILLDPSADPAGSTLPPLRLSLSLNSLRDFDDCGLNRRDVFQSDTELSARPSGKSHLMSQGQEEFFELVSRMQSKRMDEQRCDAKILADISNSKQPRHRDTQQPSPSVSVVSDKNRRLSLFGRVSSSILRNSRPLLTSTPVKKNISSTSLFTPFRKPRSRAPSSSSVTSIVSEPASAVKPAEEPVFRVPKVPPRPPPPVEARRHSMYVGELPKLVETPKPPPRRKDGPEALIDQLMQAQGRRMDEQRADLLPGLQGGQELFDKLQGASELEGAIDEQLLEMVARAQGQRMNEQRSELGGRSKEGAGRKPDHAPTIPEDDLSELVARMQKGRLEEQRAHLADAKETAASS